MLEGGKDEPSRPTTMSVTLRPPRCALWPIVGLLCVALLMPLSAAAAPSPGFSPPNPADPAQSWAWGAVFAKTDTGALSGTTQNGVPWSLSYTLHAFLAWNVILTQTNLSTTAFELSGQRVVVESYFLSAQGSQGPTTAQLNVSVQGWEQDHEFSNFTTNGSVLLNGTTPVPALAIENGHSRVEGNLTASESVALSGAQTASFNGYASGAVSADTTVSFTPALNLMPLTPVSGGQWNSSSVYLAQGTYSNACHWAFDGRTVLGATSSGSGSCGGSGTVYADTTVWLAGTDEGVSYLTGYGHYHIVGLSLPGDFAFHLYDGLFMVPTSVDLLGGGGAALGGTNAANSDGTEAFTAFVDVDPHTGHVGVVAANTRFGPQVGTATNLPFALSSSRGSGNPGALSPAAASSLGPAGASGLPTYGIQGHPESVAEAQANNACLLDPGSCLSPTSGHTMLLLLVVVVAAAAVVVAVVVARRGGGPKPPSAGGSRFIPVATSSSPGPRSTAPGGGNAPKGPPQPSQDPLGHLW